MASERRKSSLTAADQITDPASETVVSTEEVEANHDRGRTTAPGINFSDNLCFIQDDQHQHQNIESHSPDSPVSPKQNLDKPDLFTRTTNDTWFWEILSLLFSISCLISIVVILKVFDGHTLPSWPYGITLNTLIALLSTFMTPAMLVPVVAGISQYKWLWFTAKPGASGGSGRRLADFEAFDVASRGPLGCLLLLKTTWKSPLVIAGVLVTICSVGIQPMLQQSVTYPVRNVPVGTASIARAINYTQWSIGRLGTSDQGGGSDYDNHGDMVVSMKASMLLGLSNPNTSLSDITAVCPTGNCTFAPYSSLGVCGASANITESLRYEQDPQYHSVGIWRLPNGVYTQYNGFYYMNISTLTNSSLAFNDSTNPLASIYVMKGDVYGGSVTAMEIMLQLCVHTYMTTVVRGNTTTTLLSMHNESSYTAPFLSLRSSVDNQAFFIPDAARMPLSRGLQDIFSGFAGTATGTMMESSDAVQAMQKFGVVAPVLQAALAMTNNMRSGLGLLSPGRSDGNETLPALGTALGETAYIRVGWGWLALPVVLVVMTVLFLAAVAWKSRKRRLGCLKSSSLALLGGLSGDVKNGLDGLDRCSDMQKCAQVMDASLEHRGDGVGWSLQLRKSGSVTEKRASEVRVLTP